MIVQQLTRILQSGENQAEELNQLLDEFRQDRDAIELIELLDSSSVECVRIGTWFLSEIEFEKYDDVQFLRRLWELTLSETPAVRLHALSALFPALNVASPDTLQLITRLCQDENEGVRLAANAAAKQLAIFE